MSTSCYNSTNEPLHGCSVNVCPDNDAPLPLGTEPIAASVTLPVFVPDRFEPSIVPAAVMFLATPKPQFSIRDPVAALVDWVVSKIVNLAAMLRAVESVSESNVQSASGNEIDRLTVDLKLIVDIVPVVHVDVLIYPSLVLSSLALNATDESSKCLFVKYVCVLRGTSESLWVVSK